MDEKSSDNLSRRGFFQRLRQGIPDIGPFGGAGSSAEEEAIEALEERGVSVLELSRKNHLLQIQCKRVEDAFGDPEMELLQPLSGRISWLDVGNTDVTDEGLRLTAKMPELRRLYLQNTAVGDDAMESISGLAKLEYLNLYGTRVTNDGIRQLTKCDSLQTLYLWQTSVTEDGVEVLREHLPDVEVTYGDSYFDGRKQSATFD